MDTLRRYEQLHLRRPYTPGTPGSRVPEVKLPPTDYSQPHSCPGYPPPETKDPLSSSIRPSAQIPRDAQRYLPPRQIISHRLAISLREHVNRCFQG
ncbi:jg8038 [Pararge aegeria aegeria]|uniref:Jg8038 protein n=1 Tax=Pararge aegeria aegeria TaxID=348720 RepID=A0A8S4RI88_9NEOP|nr:jg8038 [Pararge aegeria aegeria]